MNVSAQRLLELFTTVDNTVDIIETDLTPIQEFYRNSNVLITGCTGFLGHALLEKLLRSCPVSKIFIVIRNKKGKNIEERLDEMFKDPIFQRVKNQFPGTRDKVVPVEGNVALPDLGICDQDRSVIMDEVDIVFHVAATVRFDEKIKMAVDANVRAPIELLKLARQMPRLKSFMHVSTIYSNYPINSIGEHIYPPALSYEKVMSMVENVDEKILDAITPRLLGKYPNTYAYTKQIAEDAVKQEGQGLPVGIHRPAIVVSSYKEPIRGWINSMYGITGIVLATGLGLLRVMQTVGDNKANGVPVDMCVNSLITAAWDVAETFKEGGQSEYQPIVYNYESTNDKPVTWNQLQASTQKYGVLFPYEKIIWYVMLIFPENYYLSLILWFLLHTVPAVIIDGVLLCRGKPTMMLKAYKKLKQFCDVTLPFRTNQWIFNSNNVKNIINKMGERDRKIFFSDLRELDWDEFFKCYILGSRTYLTKESLDTLPASVKVYRRLYWAHQATKVILGLLVIWASLSLVSLVFCRYI